ncbi:DUF4007 family protein [Devosia sp. Leaf420]|uniref:DUF4007 family protein n=1 Tax=Devosia sp. Leaf420 TaxID=1736374 RepID=UPI000780A605|nr:DUF4007 family protein [Devosia sp. Leaf420]
MLDRAGSKVQFAGHETFPCRYGWLKKTFDAIDLAVNEDERRRVFSPEVAISGFGVGKNMVASMRHWALACGVVEANVVRGKIVDFLPTRLGRTIFGAGDPFLERPGSLWALHWKLVSGPGRATAWYYAFNEFNDGIFSRESLASKLMARLDDLRGAGVLAGSRITSATVERDVDCLIRTYVARSNGKGLAEDGLECPFAELGLMGTLAGVGAVQFRRGPKPSLPDFVFAFALIDFWQTHYPSRGSLSVETVSHEPGSPGRSFGLDEDSIVERLERIDLVTNKVLGWDESTGLRQVTARSPIGALDFEGLLEDHYAISEEAA